MNHLKPPTMNRYPRETNEFQPVELTFDGDPVVDPTGWEFQIVLQPGRPSSGAWVAPVVADERFGVQVVGLSPGRYSVWARHTSDLETPVLELDGSIFID